MADDIETRGSRSHRRGDSLVQFLEQEPAVAEEAAVKPEERAVSLTPSPSKLMTSVTETLFHRPAAPPLEELPTEALERELHRRRSVSPRRPAADQSNGLSDESDGADSMSDDASFIHGDDDLDSNGTLSPIPSRSTTPVFYDAAVDPSTPRSLTPILYESVLDPEATPTHFRPVVEPSASARLLDFGVALSANSQFCLLVHWEQEPKSGLAVEPVHQRFVGRHDELEAHRVAALVRVVRQREAPVRRPEDPRRWRPTPRRGSRAARRSPRRWPTRPRSGGFSNTRRQRPAPAEGIAPARASSADAGRDGPGEQIRFFALHRARDDYGRQARDEDSQHKEQVERGRAVVFFYMNHGFAPFKEINLRGVEDVVRVVSSPNRRAAALSWFSLSASRGVLYARATSWRLASGFSRPAAPARTE